MSRRNEPDPAGNPGGLRATAADVEAAFRDAIRAHPCPACGAPFTDYAVYWGNAWREGYLDCLYDQGWMMRDGPFKLKCEACGRRSWYKFLADRVELAEERAH